MNVTTDPNSTSTEASLTPKVKKTVKKIAKIITTVLVTAGVCLVTVLIGKDRIGVTTPKNN